MSNVGSTPGSSVFTLQTVNSGSTAAMRQNYANWNASLPHATPADAHRRRARLPGLGQQVPRRLHHHQRHRAPPRAPTGSSTSVTSTPQRRPPSTRACTRPTATASTPLRGSLSKVGRYFANKAPGQASTRCSTRASAHYAILSTDGYWNTELREQHLWTVPADEQHRRSGSRMPAGVRADARRCRSLSPDDGYALHHGDALALRPRPANDTANWRRYDYVVEAARAAAPAAGSQIARSTCRSSEIARGAPRSPVRHRSASQRRW